MFGAVARDSHQADKLMNLIAPTAPLNPDDRAFRWDEGERQEGKKWSKSEEEGTLVPYSSSRSPRPTFSYIALPLLLASLSRRPVKVKPYWRIDC